MCSRRFAAVRRVRLLLGALALAAGLPLRAADTGTLVVSAVVLSKNNCKFNSTTLAINFGALDPSLTTPATASGSIVFRCKGSSPTATWSVSAGDGLHSTGPGARQLRHADFGEFMAYSLDLPATGTVPKNTDYTLTVTATIAPADFQDVIAGSYSDTVAISLTP